MCSLKGLKKKKPRFFQMKGLRKPKRKRPWASQGFRRKQFQGKATARKFAPNASRNFTPFVALDATFQAIRSPKPNPPRSISSFVSAENGSQCRSETSEKVLISSHAFFCCPPIFHDFCFSANPSPERPKWAELFRATFPQKPREKR